MAIAFPSQKSNELFITIRGLRPYLIRQSKVNKTVSISCHDHTICIDRDDKIEILTALRTSIINNLEASAKAERIAIKYEWLASQFNGFIDEYINTLRFLETEIPTDEEIQAIQLLKIQGYAN